MAGIIIQLNREGQLSLQETFNHQLDYLMPRKGYSAKRLCDETGISQNTLSTFRKGKRSMTLRTMELLLNHLLKQNDVG